MEKKQITVDELSILVWIKVLDDYTEARDVHGNPVDSLMEKIEMFDVESADIERKFFDDTFKKLVEFGLLEMDGDDEVYITEYGKKIVSAIEEVESRKLSEESEEKESAKIASKVSRRFTIESSAKEIAEYIRDNRTEITKAIIKAGINIGIDIIRKKFA